MRTKRFGGAGQKMIGISILYFFRKVSCNSDSLNGKRGNCRLVASDKGSDASEPMNFSGQGSARDKALQRFFRAASASARLRAMTSGQPPGSIEPMQRMASGTHKNAEGSARSLPAELKKKSGTIFARRIGAVTDGEWPDQCLFVRTHMEKRRAFGRAKPFVAIAGVISRAKIAQVQRYHAWGMSAINQRVHSPCLQLMYQFSYRQDNAGLARHMIHERKFRPGSHSFENRCNYFRVAKGKRDFYDNDVRAGAFGNKVQGIAGSIVFVIGYEQFIARLKYQRTQDGVNSSGRVGHKNQVITMTANESRQRFTGTVHRSFQFTHKKLQRLTFQPPAPFHLKFENGTRAGTERAMIQENHFRIQQPKLRICGWFGNNFGLIRHAQKLCEKPSKNKFWMNPFFESSWGQAKSRFGAPSENNGVIWQADDICLRRQANLPMKEDDRLQDWLHHDKDAWVYINGFLAARASDFITSHDVFPLTSDGRAVLKGGRNLTAIHYHRTFEAQCENLGFVRVQNN